MSSGDENGKKLRTIEILDWNSLVQYTLFLCQGDEQKMKICLVDEEQEQIRIKTKDEFESNVQCAREQGLTMLTFFIYKNDQLLFEGFYQVDKNPLRFPTDKLRLLEENVLAQKWFIPVKQDDALGLCLKSSIEFVQKRRQSPELERFIEKILPETFNKLLNSTLVYSWPREIQQGIFDMTELLIDLIGVRIQRAPIPVDLLELLALVFNSTTTFSKRNKHKTVPYQRVYVLFDQGFLQKFTAINEFAWLKSFLQRFLAQSGLKYLRQLFDHVELSNPNKAATEYDALLKVFMNCSDCINGEHFRMVFTQPVQQAMQYVKRQTLLNEVEQLDQTLKQISAVYQIHDELDQSLAAAFNPKISEKPMGTFNEVISSTVPRKSKNVDETEIINDDLMNLTMSNDDEERKSNKKQRTEEQPSATLFNRNHLQDCIDQILKNNEKRLSKRKHRRVNLISTDGHSHDKNSNSNFPTYDRTKPAEILKFFGPMKAKVDQLYNDLQIGISRGNVREVLKIEEKLKLLRPYSARFVADENTPDGTIMETDKIFRKGWILFNDGSLPWDSETIELVNLSNGIEIINQPMIPVTAPHSKAVISVDFRCSNQPGIYESKWILSYRNQTFGPMFWCSIEVRQSLLIPSLTSSFFQPSSNLIEENMDFIQVNLPECFDLSKPFRSQRSMNFQDSISSDLSELRFDSIEDHSQRTSISEISTTTVETQDEPKTLIVPVNEEEKPKTSSSDFVELFVSNICNVTNQARNTAKAIFNSLQAIEETSPPISTNLKVEENQSTSTLMNSYQFIPRPISTDPMTRLIEMGFANRAKNQRLLRENNNEIEKVVEILTSDSAEDPDWFNHRHGK